jgi:hypothetical protein
MKRPNDKENMNKKDHMDYIIECAKNNYGLRSHGFLYKVTNGFSAMLVRGIYIKDNKVMSESFKEKDYIAYRTKYIKKGSIIEFRYECNAHCRDIDNDYWVIDKSILALCCEPYAKIEKNTRWENKLNLKEILEKKLYIEMENNV